MEVLSTPSDGRKTAITVTYFHKRIPTANVMELLQILDGKRRATHSKETWSSCPFPSLPSRARQINA